MQVIIRPNSKKNEIIKIEKNILTIAIKAVPENGKANIELIKFMNKHFNKKFKIISGFTSRQKLVVEK